MDITIKYLLFHELCTYVYINVNTGLTNMFPEADFQIPPFTTLDYNTFINNNTV